MSGAGTSGPYTGQMQSVHPELGRVSYGPLSQLQDLQTFRRTGLVPFGQQEVQQPLILPPSLPQFNYSAYKAQQAAAQPAPIAVAPGYMNPENAGPGVGAGDGAGAPGDGGGGGGGGSK